MPQKYLMRIGTGLPFGGNQVPGRMMPSGSTYTLDAEGQIEAHQIDIEKLREMGFVPIAQPGRDRPAAVASTPPFLAGDAMSEGPLSPAPAFSSGITQLIGNVTAGPGTGTQVATIAANVVTNAKLAPMAANTLKGNSTGSTANAADLTAAQVTTMLNPMVGDSGSGGAKGLVPAPKPGDAAAGKYLKASGVWTVPPALGISQLTGDVTAGPGAGSQPATIAAGAVTSAKMVSGAAAANVGSIGGDLTGTLPNPTIANNAVTNTKLAQMGANTLKGNNTGGTANAADLTVAQATAMLNAMVGDSGAGGTKGLVPAPSPSAAVAGKYLKADGTWAVPPGSGITQLTGDITAGPGSGSQAASLANTGVVVGSYTSANITVDAKGRITAASNGTAGGSGSTNVIILQGNSTGTYSAPGLTASNKLLYGFSAQDDLSSTTFNFSPSAFVLASNQLNIANGWYAGTGQIIDPTATDWSGYNLIWLYQ